MASDMNVETAFDVLGIPIDATEGEIYRAYKTASRFVHPDVNGGTEVKQVELNAAKVTALAHCRRKGSLVPMTARELTEYLHTALAHHTAHSSEQALTAAKRRVSGPIDHLKWTAMAVSAYSAIIALLGSNMFKAVNADEAFTKKWTPIASKTMIVSGLVAIGLQYLVSLRTKSLETFQDSIKRKVDCATALAEVLEYKDIETISADALVAPSRERYMTLIHVLGTGDSQREILIAKAVEHGLLIPQDVETLTPDFQVTYSVEFLPSLFAPKASVPSVQQTDDATDRSSVGRRSRR